MQASCIPRCLHCAICSRKSGSRISAPYFSIKFCFRYCPERPHFEHDRRTTSAGYSRSLSEPLSMTATQQTSESRDESRYKDASQENDDGCNKGGQQPQLSKKWMYVWRYPIDALSFAVSAFRLLTGMVQRRLI